METPRTLDDIIAGMESEDRVQVDDLAELEDSEEEIYIEGKTRDTSIEAIIEMEAEENESLISWEAVERLDKDLKEASLDLHRDDVRLLLNIYYGNQRQRIRLNNQLKAANKAGRPTQLLEWTAKNWGTFERNCQGSLSVWSEKHAIISVWGKHVFGMGPLLSAGLLAHLNETTPRTVGHWWSFAGLQPGSKWYGEAKARAIIQEITKTEKGDLTLEQFHEVAAITKRKVDTLYNFATTTPKGGTRPLTVANLSKSLARRPWNAELKTILWRWAQVQIRLYHRYPEKSVYGPLYYERKAYEQQQNESGALKSEAERALREKKFRQEKTAYKIYASGMLPPGHIQARAYRWIEKLFLAHWHQVSWEVEHMTPVIRPWVVEYMGHGHVIPPPGWDLNEYKQRADVRFRAEGERRR